ASPYEASELRKKFGGDFLLVIPGIRLKGYKKNEQKRVLGPKEAIERGADFLVVGRPILTSDNPVKTTKRILKEIES
ncbi:orotidine-5'-phosphate decarboxylase, partial [Candidatus Aerophobetes bacterium]